MGIRSRFVAGVLTLMLPVQSSVAAPMSCGDAKEAYSEVGCLLDQLVAAKTLPGASVLILRDGRESYFHEIGDRDLEGATPVSRDTIFRIYSMTKPITTAAIMILVDEGKIKLSDPVSTFVPELSHLRVYAGIKDGIVQTALAGSPTIENLLTHTAGFTYFFQTTTPVAALYKKALGGEDWRFNPTFGGLEGLARRLGELPLAYPPNARWHYSMSLDVAGLVVERASGLKLDAFFKEHIFEPLGMQDTAFTITPAKAARFASLYGPAPGGLALVEAANRSELLKSVPGLAGGSGLTSTIDDYARFAQMLAQGGELHGRRVLSKASVAAMMRNHLLSRQLTDLPATAAFGLGGGGDGLGFGYGGAVVVNPRKLGTPASRGEYAWGGAASTTFWIDPVNHLVVVFMTQLIPPSSAKLRDKLHTAVYGSLEKLNSSIAQ